MIVFWWVWWSDEELVEQAIQVILETRKASATLLQRKLNIGFARAIELWMNLKKEVLFDHKNEQKLGIYLYKI